jgi:serine/threonine protein kinase
MGGFGITYRAQDKDLHELVAIKEYLPTDLAQRQGDSTVTARSESFEKDFEWGLNRFLDEAITLAKFRHNHIVRVKQYFKQNGTAYLVMEYENGPSLEDVLNRSTSLSETETKRILLPILDGLKKVHEASYLHRDIKPSNIIIRDSDGGPVLIDFGAARQAIGPKTQAITAVLTPGYAPLEQYSPDDNQGPWTDIYALGAVAYRCLTGEKPPYATMRVRKDPLIPLSSAAKSPVSAKFAQAIEWALRLEETARPQSIDEFIAALSGPVVSGEAKASGKADKPKKARKQKEKTALPSEDSKKVVQAATGTALSPTPDETRLVSPSAGSVTPASLAADATIVSPKPASTMAGPASQTGIETPATSAGARPVDAPDMAPAVAVKAGLEATVADAPVEATIVSPAPAIPTAEIRVDTSVAASAAAPPVVAAAAVAAASIPLRRRPAVPWPATIPLALRKIPKPVYLGGAAGALLAAAILVGLNWPASMPSAPSTPAPPAAEKLGFDEAVGASTITALRAYLAANPESPYAQEAQQRLAALEQEVEQAWSSAVTGDSVAGYDAFLAQYGEANLHVAEAEAARERVRPEEVEWQRAFELQTVSAYQQYLHMFPTGRHQADAQAGLSARWSELAAAEDRAGRAAAVASTVFPCREYLRTYPDGRHIQACQTKIESLTPLLVDYQRKLITLGAYRGAVVSQLTNELITAITSFQSKGGLTQNGIFDTPTTAAIDKAVEDLENAYSQAKDRRTRRDYEAFVQAYPNSSYSQEVRSRISQCRVEARTGAPSVSRIQHEERVENDPNVCAAANAKAEEGARNACTARGGRAAGVSVLKSEEVARPILGGIFGLRACVATVEAQCEMPGAQTSVDICP